MSTYLNREIIRSKTEVVLATKGGMLRPQVHFNMLEEVMILWRSKEFVSEKEVTSTARLCFPEQSLDKSQKDKNKTKPKKPHTPSFWVSPKLAFKLEILLPWPSECWDYYRICHNVQLQALILYQANMLKHIIMGLEKCLAVKNTGHSCRNLGLFPSTHVVARNHP